MLEIIMEHCYYEIEVYRNREIEKEDKKKNTNHVDL